MVYSYIRSLRNGACAQWLKTSKWSKYLVCIAMICGILAGNTINNVFKTYQEVSQPKIVEIDNAVIHQENRNLEVTISNSFPKQCEKISYHMLHSKETNQYYSLTPGIGGLNYSLSKKEYKVNLDIPNNVPDGDYDYNIRALYLCNFYGFTLFYPTQTATVDVKLQ